MRHITHERHFSLHLTPKVNLSQVKRYLSQNPVQVWTVQLSFLCGPPHASTEQPLDAKPVDQKEDIIIPSPDDPQMLEGCENHERGPNPG